MRSIKRFLIINLLFGLTIILLLTASSSYFLDHYHISQYLDKNLKAINHLIFSISNLQNFQHNIVLKKRINFDHNYLIEISQKSGRLLFGSSVLFQKIQESPQQGFHNIQLTKSKWRVYSHNYDQFGVRISVAESLTFRRHFQTRISKDNLFIILCTYPFLGLLIWWVANQGLSGAHKLEHELKKRTSTDLKPLTLNNIPIEVAPFITELNNLLARLKQALETNKRFASDAAHELRTPLAALKTQIQVALLTKDAKEQEKIFNQVVEGINRCTHVVQQLLVFSRLGKETETFSVSTLNFSKIVSNVLSQLAPFAIEKKIELELVKPKTAIKIQGNEIALNMLVRNLVDNAIRYTPQKGDVTVNLSKTKKAVVLSVTDTGPGIPTELHEQVFERFYRILGTGETGSGLGLAIVKQIADLHGAEIKLTSPESGQGLKVDVIFPV